MTKNPNSLLAARLTRRTFLRLNSVGASLLATGALSTLFTACSTAERGAVTEASADFTPDVEIALRAGQDSVAILPGAATDVWRYTGEVQKGDPAVLQMIDGSYLGPIVRLHKGQKVRIHFQNELPEASIIHWHGLLAPAAMDGHPKYAIAAGASYVYEFEVKNQAGTYWFHPHPHGRTGPQVYNGLAGLFIVTDDEEQALELPSGEFDIPLVIQDRLFDADNQFLYQAQADESGGATGGGMGGMMHGNHGGGNMGNMADGGMMAQMMGQLGDRILVNGQPDAELEVSSRAYRLRLLNGSNSRIYKLAWDDGAPLTVIGTDAGLLERPIQKEYVTLGPGARIELWADFSQDQVGKVHTLRSMAFSGVEMGNMMGMMEGGSLAQGADFAVLAVRVGSAATETHALPDHLVTVEKLDPSAAANADAPRQFELSMQDMQWSLNGRSFELETVAADERVDLGALELWEFVNRPGQGMMADFMAHPMHIHGVHFQVVNREVDPAYAAGWESLSAGYVDEGWRDTVLVMPGERVQVLMRFTEPGLFLYHCHNLEHEDGGMMRNFEVM